jgi:hypothetical protein
MKSLAYAATLFALTSSFAFAQEHKMSDEDLIKLSLSAAPEAIAKDATILAMDHMVRCVHCAKEPGSGRACQVTLIRPIPTRCAVIRMRSSGLRPG